MRKKIITVGKVIDLFLEYFEIAKLDPDVKKLYAWALYQTWKEIDVKEDG